jgi:hypothetical protein
LTSKFYSIEVFLASVFFFVFPMWAQVQEREHTCFCLCVCVFVRAIHAILIQTAGSCSCVSSWGIAPTFTFTLYLCPNSCRSRNMTTCEKNWAHFLTSLSLALRIWCVACCCGSNSSLDWS